MIAGPGDSPMTSIGPLINADQRETVATLVDDATGRGARVRTGGYPIDGPGYFYAPTVLDQVPSDARLLTEEIFGPVAAVVAFDSEQEGIDAANNTEYGLAAYFYTQNIDRALRVADSLHSGMVGVNRGVISDAAAPFGGIKQSGFGREGGREGIEEYLDTKYVAL
jgi:succinate-semialdehyde dehydrogenase/glutarate-semialdehyde dehydrogenase